MNKNILKISGVLALMAMLGSCEKYLDLEPITETTWSADSFKIKDAEEAEQFMKACYNEFGGEYWQLDQFVNGDTQSENSYAGADNQNNFQLDEYRIYTTNGNVERDWRYLSTLVDKCNKIIYYVQEVSDLSQNRKDEMIGEASAMRALANFHATQLWGEWPLITKVVPNVTPENIDEVYPILYPKRNTVDEVYSLIISDLTTAIAKAPASSTSNKGLATKNAAKGLLAKVYATKPSPDWAKVDQYSSEVINGGYSLLSNYENLFDGNNELNAESIWEADGQGWGSTIGAWGTFMFAGTDWKKFMVPSQDLVKTYDDESDAQRKATSIKFASVTWPDNFWGQTNYPFANKMRKTNGDQNFYFLRLADIILLKAEAKAQQNDFSGAADLVNQVRSRVGLPNISFVSKDDALTKILKERKLELSFEGHYWYDLKRSGKAISILSNEKNGNGVVVPYAGNINQNRLLWPIPQLQRDKNPNLTQNPGY